MRHFAVLLALLILLLARGEPRADTTVYSSATTPIVSADWADAGAGPALVSVQSLKSVFIAVASVKPSASAKGIELTQALGPLRIQATQHIWLRAADAGVTADKAPIVVVTPVSPSAVDHSTPGVSDQVVAGPVRESCVTPTITASTYASNQPIGGVLTFAGAFGSLRAGMIHTIVVTARTTQTVGLVFYPLAAALTSPANLADHATPSIAAADAPLVRGPIALSTPFTGLGTHTTWSATGVGELIVSADTSLRGVLVPIAATDAFGATDSLRVCVYTSSDN